jgi:opine dehydrogenase
MNSVKTLEKPVAVLGGGATAQTFAADLTLSGYEVRLYELPEFASRSLGEVLKTHEIELGGPQLNFKWFRRAGVAKVDVVTTEMSEALGGAGLIIVAIPAKGHRLFFEKMIPYLEDGQAISIFPDNFGSLVLRRMMLDNGCDADLLVGGWSTVPYAVRLVEPGKPDCLIRTYELFGEALPGNDGNEFFETLRGIPAFDGTTRIRKGDTIIGIDLSNPNPVTHVPSSILNVGAMEVSEMEGILGIPSGGYSVYKHGMSPAVSRAQFAFYQEERKIADAMGIRMVDYWEGQFFCKLGVVGTEFQAPFSDVVLAPIPGPNSVGHRYFAEDLGLATVTRYNLAKKFGVEVPIIESLIRLGSAVCGRDFFREGLSLEELGIDDLTKAQIIRYLREGVKE